MIKLEFESYDKLHEANDRVLESVPEAMWASCGTVMYLPKNAFTVAVVPALISLGAKRMSISQTEIDRMKSAGIEL